MLVPVPLVHFVAAAVLAVCFVAVLVSVVHPVAVAVLPVAAGLAAAAPPPPPAARLVWLGPRAQPESETGD